MSVIELDKIGKSSKDEQKEEDIVKNSRTGKKLATGNLFKLINELTQLLRETILG